MRLSSSISSKKKGFTLVELLVVVGIIAVLGAVILPNINSARLKSRDSKRVSDVKQIQLALELYFNINRSYPNSSQVFPADLSQSVLVTSGLISSIPKDPLTGGYFYVALSNTGGSSCVRYHLGASLEQNNSSIMNEAKVQSSGAYPACTGETGSDFSGGTSAPCVTSANRVACFDVTP